MHVRMRRGMCAAQRTFATLAVVLGLLSAEAVLAQQSEQPSAPPFKAKKLQQLLAPIALYPDELIAWGG